MSSQKESFLDIYLRYTSRQESPEMFHLWTGITVLASALGRKCYIDRGYYQLYPNIFCILVAGSAKCRKSTAINIGVRLLEGIRSTKVISGKITPEKFIQEIYEAKEGDKAPPAVLVHSSELSVFLTKQSYGEPLIYLLTDLFDCPESWTYKTKNKGEVHLRDVFLCIIAATTPDGIAKGIPPSALHEGFFSRVLTVYQADTSRRNAFPELSAEEAADYIALKQLLNKLASLQGEFTLTNEAKDWFRKWYDIHMATPVSDKRLEGMMGRKHDHLLRIAMVLTASWGLTVIEPDHLEAALMTLETLEKVAPAAFSQMGGSEIAEHIERAKTILRHWRRLIRSEFLKRLHPVTAFEFKQIVDTLVQSGIARFDEKNPVIIEWIGED